MKHRAYSVLEIKAVDEDKREITGVATTPSTDRTGDIVEPLGVKFKNPMPLLWQHRTDQPVGKVWFDKPTKNGIKFTARLPKIQDPGPLKDRVDTAWGEVKADLVSAVSIGFKEIEYSRIEGGGIRYIETEVLELSLVTIPANADATIQTIKSIDADLLAASGQQQEADDIRAGVTVRKKSSIVVKVEETKMKKSIADTIASFVATREVKHARMVEIMDKSAEDGETLDGDAKAEYDGLKDELKEIDEHIVRLKDMEAAAVKTAVAPNGGDGDKASQARAGVRVESVRANLPKGIPFVRFAIALAKANGNRMEAFEIAKANKTWKDQTPEVETVLKAAVAAGTTTDASWAAPLVEYQNMSSEFIEFLRPRTIIGQMQGLRRVPFNIKVPRQTAAASVNWVGQAKPKPVSSGAFDSITLDFFKIAGIVALTEELVRFSNPSAEALVREDLAAGIIQFMDSEFIDPDKALSAGVSPASITNGVTPVAATGATYAHFKADVKAVMAKFRAANISPEGMVIIMTQGMALSLSLMETSLGQQQFPGLNMQGGTLLGFPVITSENIPATEDSPDEGYPLIFVKASEIMLADDGQVMIDVSREASLQMDSAPTDPVAAATVLVSLWQHNMVGIRAERMVNWAKRRPAAVQMISAANYV